VTPFQSNCWLVGCDETGEAVVVDPGGEVDRAARLCEPGGFRVTRIFCTHGHIDHVAGGAEAQRRFGAPLSIHAAERDWLGAISDQAAMFGFEPVEPPAPDHLHADGEVFQVGAHEARVIHTPGHTRGGCCLWMPDARVVFTGDTLFVGSVGRTDLPGGDFSALERSIQERLFTLGDDVTFHPGHGPSGSLAEERRTNPFVGERARRGRYL
jgi:glyoxylase-like metal-dependent hydrolase (beta-lactamase superfamily II)